MIQGISIYEILTLTSIIFFIGIYGFLTRKNLITMLLSIELILNASAINFVVINTYLYPDVLQGVFFSVFIVAIAAAETARSGRNCPPSRNGRKVQKRNR